MEANQAILKLIGEVVAYGGGAAVITYALFRYLGQRWIENKFAEKLEAYKHAQTKELEEIKFKINSLFNRVTKIHEKEFEVLSEAWGKLNDVLNFLSSLVSPYQEYPDFKKMSNSQLEEFLRNARIYDFEKDELRKADNKVEYFIDVIFWHRLNDANRALSDFHLYIQKNQIFLSYDLKEQFMKIDEKIWDVLITRETSYEYKDRKMWSEITKKMREEIAPIKQKIEELVQKRLHYHEVD